MTDSWIWYGHKHRKAIRYCLLQCRQYVSARSALKAEYAPSLSGGLLILSFRTALSDDCRKLLAREDGMELFTASAFTSKWFTGRGWVLSVTQKWVLVSFRR